MPEPQKIPEDFKKFPHDFPTRENCDPENPYQAYLWALVALPYQNGGQLAMPVDYLQFVSQRLWDCFGPPKCTQCGHVEGPKIKYRRPTGLEPNWMSAPGRWVPVSEPDPVAGAPAERAAAGLIPPQQAELFRALYRKMTPGQRAELMRETAEDMMRDLGGADDSA